MAKENSHRLIHGGNMNSWGIALGDQRSGLEQGI